MDSPFEAQIAFLLMGPANFKTNRKDFLDGGLNRDLRVSAELVGNLNWN
jgi:hypothetical protein